MPLTEVMVQAADGLAVSRQPVANGGNHSHDSREADWWREVLYHSEDFKRDVAALIDANHSAIFMLLRNVRLPFALDQLRNYGNTVIHTSVSAEQDDRLTSVLARN